MKRSMFFLAFFFAAGLIFSGQSQAGYKLDADRLRAELSLAGIKTGKNIAIHGIPCLEAELPAGKSVADICLKVPLLREEFPSTAKNTGFFNHLNFKIGRGEKGEILATQVSRIFIPLDTTVYPSIFPNKEKRFSGRKNTIVIDRKKQWGALYEGEEYVACFPVSTGAPGHETPAMKGVVRGKFEEYWSEKHQIFMWPVVQFSPEVCLYGGLMDGRRKTRGSVRGFPEHVRSVYESAEVGKTHFEIR